MAQARQVPPHGPRSVPWRFFSVALSRRQPRHGSPSSTLQSRRFCTRAVSHRSRTGAGQPPLLVPSSRHPARTGGPSIRHWNTVGAACGGAHPSHDCAGARAGGAGRLPSARMAMDRPGPASNTELRCETKREHLRRLVVQPGGRAAIRRDTGIACSRPRWRTMKPSAVCRLTSTTIRSLTGPTPTSRARGNGQPSFRADSGGPRRDVALIEGSLLLGHRGCTPGRTVPRFLAELRGRYNRRRPRFFHRADSSLGRRLARGKGRLADCACRARSQVAGVSPGFPRQRPGSAAEGSPADRRSHGYSPTALRHSLHALERGPDSRGPTPTMPTGSWPSAISGSIPEAR